MRKIRDKFYGEFREPERLHEGNEEIMEAYWKEVYSTGDRKDQHQAKLRLVKAIKALEDLDLRTASKVAIQKKVDKHSNPKDVASILNQVLQFAGRRIKLTSRKLKSKPPKYLNANELSAMLSQLDCPDNRAMGLLCQVAFGGGLKLGEAFGLEPRHLRYDGKAVFVEQQITDSYKQESLDAGRTRIVPILSEFRNALQQWLDLPDNKKRFMRTWDHAKIVQEACERAMPDRKNKHCVFADLRHSFAIYLLGQGFDLDTVAKLLGVSIYHAKTLYGDFEVAPGGMEEVLEKLDVSSHGT